MIGILIVMRYDKHESLQSQIDKIILGFGQWKVVAHNGSNPSCEKPFLKVELRGVI